VVSLALRAGPAATGRQHRSIFRNRRAGQTDFISVVNARNGGERQQGGEEQPVDGIPASFGVE
jgi:hypothetical protein